MIKSYFKTAWRNLIKNKISSTINISGLAIGMAVSILIGLWIWDELSFDSSNQNYNTISQIARKEISNGDAYVSSNNNHFPIPLASLLRTNYNNLFKHVSLATEKAKHIIDYNGNKFSEQGMYIEKDFTDIFTLKMIAGTTTDFSNPNSILISRSVAQALFAKTDAVGKIIKLDSDQPLKVSGVFDDFPKNSSFSEVDFFCPWTFLINTNKGAKDNVDNWGNSSAFIFTQSMPGASVAKVSTVIKDIYWNNIKDKQVQTAGNRIDIFLHPMKDWHLRSEWKNGIQAGGQIQIVRLFAIIGISVLLLACINFINLSTARSEKRAREVGIRKAIGSLRSQLIKQFLCESFLAVVISFVLSIGLVLVSLNWFNQIADKKTTLPFLNVQFWLFSILTLLVIAFIAGSYPAFYLSSFKPVKVLKGVLKAGTATVIPRKILVTLQFTVSIILIIGTIVVYRQIQVAQNRPIGYDRNGLIRITMNTPDLYGKYDVLKTELLASGGAVGFAQSTSAATENNYFDDRFDWEGKDTKQTPMAFALTAVTYDYGKTVGWQFVDGRDFSKNYSTDDSAVILNEAAVKYMRLTNPVGKRIKGFRTYTVVGVIKDMVKESPYKTVQQSMFFMVPGVGPDIVIRLNPKLSTGKAISKIEPVFRKLNPSSPFEYRFVEDEYARKYSAEQRIGTLSSVFAILAIFISCLGIFGLASFMAEQRIKEIGIRKVLGASEFSIWQMLSKDFVMLVVISLLIAAPAAFYLMQNWLQNYEYRTKMTGWMFVAAGAGTLIITLLTVSFQAIRAAKANPVKSLRIE